MTLKRVQTTRFSSTSDATITLLRKFAAVISTLEEISEDSDMDNGTVSEANGLLKRICDIRLIISLKVLHKLFSITSPVTALLQSVSIDLAESVEVIRICMSNISRLRGNGDETWKELWDDSVEFAQASGIEVTLKNRIRKVPLLAGEICRDEAIQEPVQSLKVNVYFRALDALITQMNDRFPESSLNLFKQINLFTERSLKLRSRPEVKATDIFELCTNYGFDAEQVSKELQTFHLYYAELSELDDEDKKLGTFQTQSIQLSDSQEDTEGQSESDADEVDQSGESAGKTRKQGGFSNPMKIAFQLSAFPTLTCLYKVLLTLPVTSCSAERAMSRLKIIKNRLRSAMADDRLNSLMILRLSRIYCRPSQLIR